MAANINSFSFRKPLPAKPKQFTKASDKKAHDNNVIPLLIRGHGANYNFHYDYIHETKEHILKEVPEEERTFILPPNCYVVAKAHPGKRLYIKSKEFVELYENMCSMDYHVITDPVKFQGDKLFDAFKSVTIYPPGKPCPDFRYNLISYWDTKKRLEFTPYGSGVINIDYFRNRICKNRDGPIISSNFDQCDEFVKFLFRDSICPKSSEIPGLIQKFKDDILPLYEDEIKKDKDTVGYNYIRTMFKYFEGDHPEKFIKTQKMLCEEMAIKPDKTYIFYNFICRDTPYTNKFFTPYNAQNNYIDNTRNYLRYNANLTNENLKKLLKETISNTMLYRRYQSKPAMNRRHIKTMKNRANRMAYTETMNQLYRKNMKSLTNNE